MKTAISIYRNRIAPLFEEAEYFLLFNPMRLDEPEIILPMAKICVAEKCLRLHEQGVSVLLCGAVSRVWLKHLRELGIDVHAFLTGEVDDVVPTLLGEGCNGLARYDMPGCRGGAGGQRRRQRRRLYCDFDSLFKE